MLADRWWFWAAAAVALGGAGLAHARYRRWVAALRRRAVERRILDPGAGRRLDTAPAGFWGDLGWLTMLTGAWVALSPWIWGYQGEPGAVATDVSAGAAIFLVTAAAAIFPGLLTLNVIFGTWLLVAPWLVGYGDHGGPVGLSDTIAGLLVIVTSLITLTDAARKTRPAEPRAVARIDR
jgi:hypothetical protein